MANIATRRRWCGSFGNGRGFSSEFGEYEAEANAPERSVSCRWCSCCWRPADLFRFERLCVPDAHMQSHDLTRCGVDMKHGRRSDYLLWLRIGIDVPVFLHRVFGHKDDGVGRDILEDIFLLGNGDDAAFQDVAYYGFFAVRRGMYAFQMADNRVGQRTRLLLVGGKRLRGVGQDAAAVVDVNFQRRTRSAGGVRNIGTPRGVLRGGWRLRSGKCQTGCRTQ